jgi:hypothetical protein
MLNVIIIISGATALLMSLASSRIFFLRRFSTNLFLQSEVVGLMPNPQPGGPGSRIYIPGDRGLPWTLGTSGSPFPVPTYMGP